MAKKTNQESVISVKSVDKIFRLPHERTTTVKSLFTNLARGSGSKYYEEQQALENISFDIKKGEFFGIVGRNGSGKSTLLKILAGIYQPTEGTVEVEGRLVPFIELGVGFNPELTGRENVYLNGAMLGFSEAEIAKRYQEIVDFAELEAFMDQRLKNYSSGMQVRLAFSVAIQADAEILLIDEVLAVGDANFQRKCFEYFNYLKKTDTTVVFVTHDMDAIRQYCERAILIDDSHLVKEGTANKVSQAYMQLFNENASETSEVDTTAVENKNRWGDQKITIDQIKVSVGEDTVTVKETIKANQKLESWIAGIRIKDTAGQYITGTNTKIEKMEVKPLNKGEKVELEWKIPNIFSDGSFYIDPAVLHTDEVTIGDWWDEAVRFSIKKDRIIPYSVDADIKVRIN